MVVGLARGSSAAQTGTLPAFALILAFAVVAFAAMARGAVAQGGNLGVLAGRGRRRRRRRAAHRPGPHHGRAAPDHRRAGRPARRHDLGDHRNIGPGVSLPVAVVDPRQYAALAAGTPAPRFPAAALARPGGGAAPAGAVPVLVSAAGRAILGQGSELSVAGRELRLHIAGGLASDRRGAGGSQLAVAPAGPWGTWHRSPM